MRSRLVGTDGPCSKINALNLLKEIREDNSNMKLEQEIIINEPSGNVRHEKRKRLDYGLGKAIGEKAMVERTGKFAIS